jgi:hypothetical protein
VTILNASSSATLYFSLVSPATTSNFGIPPGIAYSYTGAPVSAVYIIGSAASGNYNVFAH